MARLPDADDSSIRLDLLYVAAIHPDVLDPRDWCGGSLLDDHWLGDDSRRRDDNRGWLDDCPSHRATDDATHETWPEVATATSPHTAVWMMMWRGTMHAWTAMRARPRTARTR